MTERIRIGDRFVGPDDPPMVVAEMSGNHNQSLERAMAIVDAAADAGAHAIKLQTYTADTMTLNVDRDEFKINDPNSLWNGRHLHDLYDQAHTPWEWHRPLFDRARDRGLIIFSTPFRRVGNRVPREAQHASLQDRIVRIDRPATDWLRCEDWQATHPLDRHGHTCRDRHGPVEHARDSGARQIILLKCTSTYPATPNSSNLRTIRHLKESFGTEVGLSDHTLGIGAAIASVALGATVIEKHFTLRRSDGGVDAAFSLEPDELKALVTETNRAWQALGKIEYGPVGAQRDSLAFRRSIFLDDDVPEGGVVDASQLRIVRPGHGLPPSCWERVCGRTARRDLKKGEPTRWDMFR